MLRFLAASIVVGVSACAPRHTAKLQSPALPPLPASEAPHSGRLWIELGGLTEDRQCSRPSKRGRLCFDGVQAALGDVLAQTAWTSFPAVAVKDKGDDLAPGDYVVLIWLDLAPVEPDERSPGWSAAARARWKLVRDGLPIATGAAASRSRGDFAYGRALGVAASEVVAAVGTHIAERVSALPEERPRVAVPLPPVAAGEAPAPRSLARR